VKALVLTGGPGAHPFDTTSKLLAEALAGAGLEASVTDDIEAGLQQLDGCRLLAVNALRWRMLDDRYAADRDAWAFRLSPAGREAIEGFMAGGGTLLASHTAPICFDDWPGWGEIVGATWVWGRSSHPELGPARIRVDTGVHPVVAGVPEHFQVVDEVYSHMDLQPDVRPLAWGAAYDVEQPLLWAREAAGGRVVYDALGHDERSLTHPAHARILRQAVAWLLVG
jgi:uncharacterized protein